MFLIRHFHGLLIKSAKSDDYFCQYGRSCFWIESKMDAKIKKTRSLKAMSIYSVIWLFSFWHFILSSAILFGNDACNWLNISKLVISMSILVEIDTLLTLFQKIFLVALLIFFLKLHWQNLQTDLADFFIANSKTKFSILCQI